MMISTRGRYALRMMLDIALHSDEGSISLKSIAQRQEISVKYLEQIVTPLSRGGLLQATRGAQGGYRLNRLPEDYTVGEILRTIEGSLAPVACLAEKDYNCPRADFCQTLPMWKEYHQMVHDFFYSRKLSDLLGDRDPIYYI